MRTLEPFDPFELSLLDLLDLVDLALGDLLLGLDLEADVALDEVAHSSG